MRRTGYGASLNWRRFRVGKIDVYWLQHTRRYVSAAAWVSNQLNERTKVASEQFFEHGHADPFCPGRFIPSLGVKPDDEGQQSGRVLSFDMTQAAEPPRTVRFDVVSIRFACALEDGLKVGWATIYTP